MKNLSLLSIATLLLSSGCVLSITDDLATDTTVDTTADDDVDDDATDDATDEATDDATEDTGDGDTTDDAEDDVDTTDETTADTTADETDTGPAGMCGWNPDGPYYECGFEGEDPGGTFPIACPDGLVDGAPCADTGLTGEGCCDANGDNWYCAEGEVVFFSACS